MCCLDWTAPQFLRRCPSSLSSLSMRQRRDQYLLFADWTFVHIELRVTWRQLRHPPLLQHVILPSLMLPAGRLIDWFTYLPWARCCCGRSWCPQPRSKCATELRLSLTYLITIIMQLGQPHTTTRKKKNYHTLDILIFWRNKQLIMSYKTRGRQVRDRGAYVLEQCLESLYANLNPGLNGSSQLLGAASWRPSYDNSVSVNRLENSILFVLVIVNVDLYDLDLQAWSWRWR